MNNPEWMEHPLVQLLLKEELITPAQAKRLARSLGKGMDPNEAVHVTPLVEPVKLASLLASLRGAPDEPPAKAKEEEPTEAAPPPPPREPTPLPGDVIDAALELDEMDLLPVDLDDGEAFTIQDLGPVSEQDADAPSPSGDDIPEYDLDAELILPGGKEADGPAAEAAEAPPPEEAPAPADALPELEDLDGDLDLDLDLDPAPAAEAPPPRSMDLDIESALEDAFEPGGEGDPAATPRPLPSSGESGKMVGMDGLKVRPVRESQREDVPATLKAPQPPEHYSGSGRVNTYNLFDDEGINLIHEVNKVLLHVMEITGQGLVLDRGRMDSNYRIYNSRWMLEEQRTIPEHELEKMINRIRVMARLEPWRRNQEQAGQCLVTAGGNTTRLLVESQPLGVGQEVLTVYFQEE